MSDKETAHWDKVRERGKWLFIVSRAVTFGVGFYLLNYLLVWFWQNPFELRLSMIVLPLCIGFIGGLTNWWIEDARYQNHILDKKIREGLSL